MKRLLFLLTAIAQIAAIGWMIAQHERILLTGTPVKFVTQPVDPVDHFRGRYVALRLDTEYVTTEKLEYKDDTILWAILETDADGYAKIIALCDKQPEGKLALRVQRWWLTWAAPEKDGEQNKETRDYTYHCSFPFENYYMNENAAPEAEKRYNEATRANRDKPENEESRRKNYLVVRILNSEGVSEQLYLEGKPVEQLLAAGK